MRAGHLTLQNYHGVFVAHARSAGVTLDNVSGTGFVESLRGRVVATDSTFDRLRVRTATGDMLFQGCTSHQIQASEHLRFDRLRQRRFCAGPGAL